MKTTVFGERIRDLRKKSGLTPEKMADLLGLSCQAVSKREYSRSPPAKNRVIPRNVQPRGLPQKENPRGVYLFSSYTVGSHYSPTIPSMSESGISVQTPLSRVSSASSPSTGRHRSIRCPTG